MLLHSYYPLSLTSPSQFVVLCSHYHHNIANFEASVGQAATKRTRGSAPSVPLSAPITSIPSISVESQGLLYAIALKEFADLYEDLLDVLWRPGIFLTAGRSIHCSTF